MTSKSTISYAERARVHINPVVKKLFEIAEAKKSNVVLSADVTTTKELLELANSKQMLMLSLTPTPISASIYLYV